MNEAGRKKKPVYRIVEIDDIPMLAGPEKSGRFPRRKRRKPPMAELGFEKLRPQQKLALVNKFKFGMSNRQAGICAGYSPNSASAIVGKLSARKAIVDKLEEAGMTDGKIAQIIVEAGDAMHPFKPSQPDHSVRLRAAQEANKVKDNYPAKKIEVEEKAVHLHFTEKDYANYRKYKQLTGGGDEEN